MKKELGFACLFAVSCCLRALAGGTSDEKTWLVVNEDNDHYFKNPSELMTEKALVDYIDYTCQGKVTHFFMCPSGQRASFDSKTWEPIWAGANEPDHFGKTNNIWCVNAKLLHDRGIDPYAVWTKRCRERGVSPWLTMRMNDVHFSTVSNYFRNTTFCRTRKDLWIDPNGKGWEDASLDYSRQEVRDYNFAHLREIVERWDVDGVELDWMRFGRHLRPGRERTDAHFLDDFVRQTRQLLDEVGAKRGRRLSLGVRVCRDPDLAIAKMGMDVAKWAKEGWVDLVVAHSFYRVDSGIAVAKWVARIAAANPKVRVIPGIDCVTHVGGKDIWLTPAMYRGVAAKFWREGAQGIYLFNLPYHGKYPTDGFVNGEDVASVLYSEGLSPAEIAGKACADVAVQHDFADVDLASYVDPFVGTTATGHTTPAAAYPFGMVQAGPTTGTITWQYCSGYRHEDKAVTGYALTALSGTGFCEYNELQVLPFSGETAAKCAIDKASETAVPGYYAVKQPDDGVSVEIAAAKRAAIYRFTWEKGRSAKVLVNLPYGNGQREGNQLAGSHDGKVTKFGDCRIEGEHFRTGCIMRRKIAFALEFNRPWTGCEELPKEKPDELPRYVLSFDLKEGEPLLLKSAFSITSPEAARRNLLSSVPAWDFAAVKASARKAWNDVFARSTCEGSDDEKRNWYTALYHLYFQPNDYSDEGDATPYYTTLSLWDTFRACHPWYSVVMPEVSAGTVDSFLRHFKTFGRLPVMSYGGMNFDCMIGNHVVPVIVDWFLREREQGTEIREQDAVYAAIKNTLTQAHPGKPKENWDVYDKYGYFPSDLIDGEGVSRTMECSYDDACAARMAKALGKDDDAAFFAKRAGYWKNVFDTTSGFARGKSSVGVWRTPFDPYAFGHGAGRDNDFTEGNAFQYSWHVMHDVDGLFAAMGGREAALKKLESLFKANDITGGAPPDVTGLIGQYVHGNEPSHHVIYLFTLLGRPDLTAKYVREVFDRFYRPKADGLCGNDDCGQMSAWYLFSAMGFYPVDPCGGEFVLGAPQIEKATLRLQSGKTFTVLAKGLSKENKFVRSVTLNGKPLTDGKIRRADIAKGGELVFTMSADSKDPVDYVNTGIGSVSHMLVPTFRTVQRPHAMYRFNGPAGQFTEDRISDLWLQNPGHRDSPVFSVRPFAGGREEAFGTWIATWDQEHATPYSYDILLDCQGVKVSMAPGERSAIFTFDFERDGAHGLSFGTRDPSGAYTVEGRTLIGTDVFHGMRDCAAKVYLYAELDADPTGSETTDGRTAVFFGSTRGKVKMRLGVSYLSVEQAKRNLRAEIAGWDLAALAADARFRWNAVLSQIDVQGGTADERAVFYTALWRCHERMVNITEDGGRYFGFDGKAHESGGVDQYTDDWIWDTFRAAHPLMTILNPKEEGDKLASYVRMGEQDPDRWMPVFPGVAGDRHSMVNRHYIIMFLDAWRKGIRGFDAKKAFELMDRTEETESLIPWHHGPLTELDVFYKQHGYYPGIRTDEKEWVKEVHTDWERRQCVSVTQGASYDAWALAEFGREIGIPSDRLAKYDARAKSYAQLWNPKTQFFHPKDKDGRFIEPFDYLICGGYGARNYFTENNAWTYIWDVQHDLGGLMRLFGGPKAMEAKLDAMLNASVGTKFLFTAQMPDGCTGLMGTFTMANEPSFHIPYLYNFCGRPDKTQKFVRKTLESWFRNDRMGMCGDEDGGGMSAYAVFSMMGFYPVTPGRPEYQWGSPVFRKVTIHLQNGRDFTIEAPAASRDAKYVRRLSIDGRAGEGLSVLKHEDIQRGARVLVEMSDRAKP